MRWLWRFDWRPELRALVLAEAETLGLGAPFAPGLFVCERPFEAGRAAFAVGGGEVLARAGREAPLELPADLERVHVVRGPFKPSGNPLAFASRLGVASARRACPHALYVTEDEQLLVQAAPAPCFVDPELPIRTSTSFAPQLARALVNLVARPGERVLDPVCGTGVVLVEAGRIGCAPTGWDLNERACRAARTNLAHQGLEPAVAVRDARAGLRGEPPFDALVADLPYGIRLEEPDLLPLATALPALARRWALVAMRDLSAGLSAAGHAPRATCAVPKYTITRYVMLGGEPLASHDSS